jgi:hypothetical protein
MWCRSLKKLERKFFKFPNSNKNRIFLLESHIRICEPQKGGYKRGIYSHECLYLKIREISNNLANDIPESFKKIRACQNQNEQKEINNKD